GESEIVPGAITAEEMAGKPAAPIGENEPDEVLEAGDLFNPRAIMKYVSMWIIGPSVSTILAYGFFRLVPGIA
ncbi:inorganic phosphate transporter, partial [Halorubrum sp. SS7]